MTLLDGNKETDGSPCARNIAQVPSPRLRWQCGLKSGQVDDSTNRAVKDQAQSSDSYQFWSCYESFETSRDGPVLCLGSNTFASHANPVTELLCILHGLTYASVYFEANPPLHSHWRHKAA